MKDNSRKLKWWVPIWDDPVGWCRWIGKSKAHVLGSIILYTALVISSAFRISLNSDVNTLNLIFGPLLFIWVLPCLFIYAIYRMSKIIDNTKDEYAHNKKLQGTEEPSAQHDGNGP